MEEINVTRSFLPSMEDYRQYLEKIWSSNQLTNQGPLLKEFEQQAQSFLGVKNFHFVTNGTLALQVALKAAGVNGGEIITTPFSYVATTSAILWERCKPVFVDIEPRSFCIDADKIEAAITKKTKAILAVHVFGYACDIEKIEEIAKKYSLKVIYDGAHAFGAKYKGRSLLSYGDISTCSFHATKLFHTIEGGCVIAKDKAVSDKIELIKRFGHHGDDHHMLGINAKASEFQAAMGLCNLNHVERIIAERKKVSKMYDRFLRPNIKRPQPHKDSEHNYAYYAVVLESKEKLHRALTELKEKNIFARRYFYPSLNTLKYLNTKQECPVSENIAGRILCLPLFGGLPEKNVSQISGIINA